MPAYPSSTGSQPDGQIPESNQQEMYDQETLSFPGISPGEAEALLKRLGGGVAEKHRLVEGVGFRATITPHEDGVSIEFDAHEELLDDLIRRFEDMADKDL